MLNLGIQFLLSPDPPYGWTLIFAALELMSENISLSLNQELALQLILICAQACALKPNVLGVEHPGQTSRHPFYGFADLNALAGFLQYPKSHGLHISLVLRALT